MIMTPLTKDVRGVGTGQGGLRSEISNRFEECVLATVFESVL